jgi:serine/threonine-protein kinase
MLAEPPNFRVKLLDQALSSDAPTRLRFLENARRLALVEHPNLGSILRVEERAGERPRVIRRNETGRTLRQCLRAATVDTDWACAVALGMLEGLAALHDRGLCHGNLKPSNVIVEGHDRPHARLVDMGLGRIGSDGSRLLGSDARFTSPEVLMGAPPTRASDLFSVAVILYEMLAGEAIVDTSEDRLAAFRAIASDSVEPLCRRNPRIAEPLARAIETCLSADAEQRLSSARAFARQIAPYALPGSFAGVALTADEEPATPSLAIARAPRPRRDLCCSEDMLLEPALPRLRSSALLEELRDEVEMCPPSETEGFVSVPPTGGAGAAANRVALFALASGASLSGLRAWFDALL